MKPTLRPAMKRPGAMTPILVEAVSRIQPTVKTPHPTMMVRRRPINSTMSPAAMAPKKVPAERIAVVRDWSWDVRWKAATAPVFLGFGLADRCIEWWNMALPEHLTSNRCHIRKLCFHGYRSFDPADISRAMKNNASGHSGSDVVL